MISNEIIKNYEQHIYFLRQKARDYDRLLAAY